jgi:hypothetical protein
MKELYTKLNGLENNLKQVTTLVKTESSKIKQLIQSSDEETQLQPILTAYFEDDLIKSDMNEIDQVEEGLMDFNFKLNKLESEILDVADLIHDEFTSIHQSLKIKSEHTSQIKQSKLNNEQLIELECIRLDLNKLEADLNDPAGYIYDECSELRRLIQLDLEETIARVKQANNLNINIEECELTSTVAEKIKEIRDESEKMIETIDNHQKSYLSSYNHIEAAMLIETELTPIRRCLDISYEMLDSSMIEIQFINTSISNLRYFLSSLVLDKAKYIIFSNNIIELKERDPKEHLKLKYFFHFKQSISLCKLFEYDLKSIIKKSALEVTLTKFDRGFKIDLFSDGKYFIAFESPITPNQSVFIVYDQRNNKILSETVLNEHLVREVKVFGQLIVLDCMQNMANTSIIMNQSLEIIHQKNLNYGKLIGADETHIYYEKDLYVKFLDWSLNEIKIIKFQRDQPNLPYYLKHTFVCQAETRSNRLFVSDSSYINIFDENGVALNSFENNSDCSVFRTDRENNLIILDYLNRVIKYFDLDGRPAKEIDLSFLESPLNFILINEKKQVGLIVSNYLLFLA